MVLNGEESSWREVVQGSVIGPVLFLIFINDLDHHIQSAASSASVFKFADDSKIGMAVRSVEDAKCFQAAVNALVQWCSDNGMRLHPDKCSILHFGYNNPRYVYEIGGNNVRNSQKERDLRVTISTDCKFSEHIRNICKKANGIVARLKRTVIYRDKEVFAGLFKTYVRPVLEASVPVWNQLGVSDVSKLEGVQRRALKAIHGLGGVCYEDRLKICEMMSLEERRILIDLCEVYKYLNGENREEHFHFIKERHEVQTRSSARGNLISEKCRTSLRQGFFTNRVVPTWNKLPNEVREAPNMTCFKNRYRHWFNAEEGL